jgi:hypothetical protein
VRVEVIERFDNRSASVESVPTRVSTSAANIIAVAFFGRWLRGEEFIYPDRPKGLPKLREPVDMNWFGRRPTGR